MRSFASLNKRRVVMTFAVLCIAFLCGQVMQSIAANPLDRAGNSKVRPLPMDPAAGSLQQPPRMPGRTKAELFSKFKTVSLPGTTCIPQLTLKRAPGAMIDLTFLGCKARAVSLRQGEMEITAETDSTGKLQLRMPAFEQKAEVSVAFNGDVIQSMIEVPSADAYQHVAIIWEGPQVLGMHAFEFGAKRNQFGHVWTGAPKSPQRAARGNGGFLTRLGDGSGASAEIYSFPAAQSRKKGVVRLMVEADVTPANCDRQVNAVAFQSSPMGGMDTTEVALKMPQCDSVGRVVRLQNLFQDMRLALR